MTTIFASTCQVHDALESVASVSGKEKEARLAPFLDCSLFQRIAKAALCPFTTYNIKKLPDATPQAAKSGFDEDTWRLLDALSARNLTGNAAKDAIQKELAALPAASAELLRKVLLKDLRAGFTAKTINRIKPGLITVFECMLAHPYEPKRIKQWPVGGEIKYDGVRIFAIYRGGCVRFFSRTGKEFFTVDHIGQYMAEKLREAGAGELVFDGELVDRGGSFNQVVGDVRRKDSTASDSLFRLFDMMTLDEFSRGQSEKPYLERRRNVIELCRDQFMDRTLIAPSEFFLLDTHEHVIERFNALLDGGAEGLIIKPLDGLYECKRSYNWLKVKNKATIDAPIVGFEEGEGKFVGSLGALQVEMDNGVRVSIGGGLTDAQRASIWADQPGHLGRMIEIEYHEMTPDGSLRHPRFVRFRDDKPVEDGAGC